MFQINKLRLLFLLSFFIGSIGAFGQAYLLYHELADCYPYKIMDYFFYKRIADIGIYLAPILALTIGFLLGLKRFWLVVIVPVFLCPVIFSIVFKSLSFISKLNGTFDDSRTFDGYTSASATQSFFVYSISLSVIGLAIGIGCSCLLLHLSKQDKFA